MRYYVQQWWCGNWDKVETFTSYQKAQAKFWELWSWWTKRKEADQKRYREIWGKDGGGFLPNGEPRVCIRRDGNFREIT